MRADLIEASFGQDFSGVRSFEGNATGGNVTVRCTGALLKGPSLDVTSPDGTSRVFADPSSLPTEVSHSFRISQPGTHVFVVRIADDAGVSTAPATRSFCVELAGDDALASGDSFSAGGFAPGLGLGIAAMSMLLAALLIRQRLADRHREERRR